MPLIRWLGRTSIRAVRANIPHPIPTRPIGTVPTTTSTGTAAGAMTRLLRARPKRKPIRARRPEMFAVACSRSTQCRLPQQHRNPASQGVRSSRISPAVGRTSRGRPSHAARPTVQTARLGPGTTLEARQGRAARRRIRLCVNRCEAPWQSVPIEVGCRCRTYCPARRSPAGAARGWPASEQNLQHAP